MRVAIVGTGVAGLGAARLLRKAGAEVTLFEKEADFGGRCRTHEWNGTWIIRGAAAFVGGEEEPVALARELGIYREGNLKDCQEEDSSCLCCCLSHQSLVGQGLRVGSALEDEAEELAFAPAALEAVAELVQVAR